MNFIKNIEPITICDIGASPINKTEFIEDLFNNSNSQIIGFEPNVEEFKKLKETPRKKYYNIAIGDGNKHNLNICHAPGMTSFLKPNLNYLKLFHGFEEWSKIVRKEKISTKKLDDLDEKIDFLKIDVQGYESEIIKFGRKKIKNSLVIQIETSPTPLYINEKSFSHVSNQLEELGFSLHMFERINSKIFKPMILNNDKYSGLFHLFQLDCVYIKNFNEIDKLNAEDLKKLILILYWSFNSYDLVDLLVRKLDNLTNKKFIIQYREIMKKKKFIKKY
tara:strand:- start:3 stop:833 length:831 start_codon:yes stop_codon:yes gene_type:complete